MTDEQKLAERYVNRIPIFADEGEGFSRTQMQQSFLDGLEAGRPKWHYVKDGDLPKEDLRQRTLGYYLTASKHKSYKGFVFEVAYFTGVVFIKGGDILDNVIAWKEIVPPKGSEINDYS